MDEVFPVLAGIVVGLLTGGLAARRLRAVAVAVLSAAFGAVASWISGELAISWAYLAIDIGQVLVTAVLTWALAAAWRRRAWRVS
jgi:hypothetical protein